MPIGDRTWEEFLADSSNGGFNSWASTPDRQARMRTPQESSPVGLLWHAKKLFGEASASSAARSAARNTAVGPHRCANRRPFPSLMLGRLWRTWR